MAERKPHTIWLAGDETRRALADVTNERIRQHQQWGVQRHDFPVWLTVLSEEVGELAQAMLQYRETDFAIQRTREREMVDTFVSFTPEQRDALEHRLLLMRAEAIQVAAVAVAMIEHIDECMTPTPASAPGAGGKGGE